MAECFLRAELRTSCGEIAVKSAGLHAEENRNADNRALQASRELGCPLEGHSAKRLTDEVIAESDIIFAMDRTNEAQILARFPSSRGKVFLFTSLKDGSGMQDIVDPFQGDLDTVRKASHDIRDYVRVLARKLSTKRNTREYRTHELIHNTID
jgi:protein-tyrosine phosphatase